MNHLQILFLGALFVAAAALAYGVASLILRARGAGGRLAAVAAETAAGSGAPVSWQVRMAELASPLARLALPDEGWEQSVIRLRFLHAGWRSPAAPPLYFAAKAGLAIVLPAILGFVIGLAAGQLPWSADRTLLLLLLAASVGYYLPNLVLAWRIERHQQRLLDAFPDAVDLIIVCIEAGLGLDAAITRCAEEMRLRSPALADELHLVGLELRVGASREQALRNLALRTGIEDFGALVTMLLQADRFGTSIADSLRVHAEGLRTRLHQRAEEAAAKLPLKLLFPLIFCIFPALMLVLLGPAMLRIVALFARH